jgi:ribonuclease HII
MACDFSRECALRARGIFLVAGVDEAGRGPLAGPVHAAAVVLDPRQPIAGLADSKVLSPARREALAKQIRERALCWSVVAVEPAEIDALNILRASLLAMRRAVLALQPPPQAIWVDGNRLPDLDGHGFALRAVVGGDARVAEISAASILAKTARDAELVALDAQYPQYGFARHKGYPTAEHLAALEQYGALAEHRKSFCPVKAWLARQQGQLF